MAHHISKFAEVHLKPAATFAGHSEGYRQAPLIDHTIGSVHTGTNMCQLEPGGALAAHFHSFEEGFYLLEGTALISIEGKAHRLKPGDFGAIKVGQVHSWRNLGSTPARWFQMAAPQPKPVGQARDTFFPKGGSPPSEFDTLDVTGAPGNLLGHFDVGQIPPPGDAARQSAGAPEGVFLKWLIDENLGAVHHRLLFIEYQPGVSLAMHDHTFEESYYILSGEVEAVIEGERYLAKPGDILWTSVGCFHAFANIGHEPVRWLETFAPQPPRENVFRFQGEWEKKAKAVEA